MASTQRLTTRSIIIAAGGEPFVPDLPGMAESGYLTSDTMWDAMDEMDEIPARTIVLGGGPIGSELAQAFVPARLRGDPDRDGRPRAGEGRPGRFRRRADCAGRIGRHGSDRP